MHELFIAEVAKQKRLKRLTNKQLAEMTNLTKHQIDCFLQGHIKGDMIKKAIAKALEMEI